MLNDTHTPSLTSWVESANLPGTDFPIQNLPHGVYRRKGRQEAFRGGVAIGDQILDINAACGLGVFTGATSEAAELAGASTLNGLMAAGPEVWSALRRRLSEVLRVGAVEAQDLRAHCLAPQAEAEYAVPARVGNFTDFFSSYDHMVNAGCIFQPDAPPLPNFKWLPLAYHGRASSVEVSGTPFNRPWGQTRVQGATVPSFGPTQGLDYEMELGFWVGPGNVRGTPILIDDAENHIFGVCLLNDWSARDVQGWESMPLGPFLAKNFITTISPWIVTMEALAPFRCALPRQESDQPTHAYLEPSASQQAFDLTLEVWLQTQANADAVRLSRSSFKHCYWSMAQMLTHHTEGGCNLFPGDLMGTGTQSGPGRGEQGCLLELSSAGRQPLQLPDGERRSFLHDGDTVILRAWGDKPGYARIGFGECRGTVLPALQRTR